MVEIDAFRTMLVFCNSAYKNVVLTGESALAVLYIGIYLVLMLVIPNVL